MYLPERFQEEGAVLLIDKEIGWTSFDVVRKIRGLSKVKKVGHAGTLDPLATGLLIICLGKKTKTIDHFQALPKEYSGIFEIGKTTPSFDLETEFNSQSDVSHITETDILDLPDVFKGKIKQSPPVYSAVKVKGQRAYKFARRGEEVNIQAKEVFIDKFEITKITFPEVHFRLKCSKGFYVRSLVRDIGERLKVGAYLKSLRREKIGDFSVEDALKIAEVEKMNRSV